jgi:para-aminobenzoate synthetase/4-amino-4-deoxychorismate lyase
LSEAMTINGDSKVVISEPGGDGGRWLRFCEQVGVVEARRAQEVRAKLEEVERAVDGGLYAAGFVTYEAAAGLDSAFRTHEGNGLPMVWFGLYRRMDAVEAFDGPEGGPFSVGQWRAGVSEREYAEAIEKVKGYIAAGDTYQVNFTLRLRAAFEGDGWGLFRRLMRAQPGAMGAYVDMGAYVICSASPELFFSLDGDALVSKPMKGTAARGLTLAEDREQMRWLEGSAKNLAENAMIVDMVRNDMGRIAEVGSVAVGPAFEVERHPTVFQMTTTVRSRTRAGFAEIMGAMFPCASITGTPKVRTMEIIRELEAERRGVYTGCVGYLAPGRRARFNVAIRTVVIDKTKGLAEYGVGGGIVWDSQAAEEYRECETKAMVLTADRPEFELLESLLWDGAEGYFLLERHLDRLMGAAEYFQYKIDVAEVRRRLLELGEGIGEARHKVRLLVTRNGKIFIESSAIAARQADRPWRVGLAAKPIDWRNPFLYHKTTLRTVYNSARSVCDDVDDVLLWNERGEVTETRIGNVVVELGGRLYTPPVSCGLLAGVFRSEVLARAEVMERAIPLEDLKRAERVFVINSVRKWLPAEVRR